MRESWTDDRLDELSRRMDKRFDDVDRRLETEARELRAEIRDLGTSLHARFDSLRRSLILGAMGMLGAFGTALIAVLAT